MSSYPPLNTQVIGQTESALGALLEPLLADAGLATTGQATATGRLALTDSGQDMYQRIHGAIDELNAELFAFPPEDLATAGRVMSIVTERANAVLARHA